MKTTITQAFVLIALLAVSKAFRAPHSIALVNLTFVPQDLTMQSNDPLVWTNKTVSLDAKTPDDDFSTGSSSGSVPMQDSTLVYACMYHCNVADDDPGINRGSTVTHPASRKPRAARTPLLVNNYPNPFNDFTTIEFSLRSHSHVRLQVFDSLGRPIALLADKLMKAGPHTVRFDPQNLPGGMYFYRLTAGGQTQTRIMALQK